MSPLCTIRLWLAYLGNFPVDARAATRAYAARKFAERHWGGMVSALLILRILMGVTVITTFQTLEARHRRDFARNQLARAEAINELNRTCALRTGRTGTRPRPDRREARR